MNDALCGFESSTSEMGLLGGDQFEQIERRMLYRPFRLNFLPFHDEFLSGPDFTW